MEEKAHERLGHDHADGSETRAHLRAGLIFYQTGDFPKALWHLKRGMEAPDANLGEFEGVDFKAILNDCRRRTRGE